LHRIGKQLQTKLKRANRIWQAAVARICEAKAQERNCYRRGRFPASADSGREQLSATAFNGMRRSASPLPSFRVAKLHDRPVEAMAFDIPQWSLI